MDDTKLTIQDLKDHIAQFVHARDWEQFHTPKNLSMALTIEASELMEIFQWANEDQTLKILETERENVEHELADVLAYTLAIANVCKIDVADAFMRKMALNAKKYPVEKAKGRSDKYHTYK